MVITEHLTFNWITNRIQVTGQTLVQANWTLIGSFYEYDLANANILSTSFVDVIPDLASYDIAIAAEMYPNTLSSTGSVKLYTKNAPTGDIIVTINIY